MGRDGVVRHGASLALIVGLGLGASPALAQPPEAEAEDPPVPANADQGGASVDGEPAADPTSDAPGPSTDGPDAGGETVPTPPLEHATVDGRCGACSALGTLPPAGGSPSWEWIRRGSGETFGGDFRGMQDGRLRFDSDEVGDLEFDWADVHEFYSPDPITVVTEARDRYIGPAQMLRNEAMVVHTASGDVFVPKDDILLITTGAGEELSRWYFKLAAGLNLADATNDQLTLSSITRIRRDDAYTRLTLNHDLSYGLTEDAAGTRTETANNQWGRGQFDVFVSRRFYVTAATVTLGYDRLQNILFRVTPGAGVGVHVVDGTPVDFDVELSGGYQYTRFVSVQPGDVNDTNGGGGGYRLYFDWDAFKGFGITLEHRGFIIYSDVPDGQPLGQSTFRTSLILDLDIGSPLDVDITGTWDRVIQPRPLEDGTEPQADTVTVLVSLGIELGQ